MSDVPDPRIIADKYVLGPLLGRGAVGEVYLARHRLTGSEVALKVIPSRMIGSEPGLQRFHREVSVANRIGHPGMVKVHDAGWSTTEDAYYLAMERLSGQSLGAWADGPEVDLLSGVRVVRAMLEPLAAAHAAGIVHRDLKPENVFLHQDPRTGERIVKLLDFGIARDQRELQSATLADMTLGTPAFMSPEQATSAKEATPTSDVWSVGVMLYWLYSGRVPFEHETVFNTLTAICTLPHPPLEGHTPSELALIAVIESCLRKDPAARPKDARALATALDAWIETVGPEVGSPRPRADTEARPFGGGEAIQGLTLLESPPQRAPRLLALVLGVTLAGALGWWAWPESSPSVEVAPAPPAAPTPTPAPPTGTTMEPAIAEPSRAEPGPEPQVADPSRRTRRRPASKTPPTEGPASSVDAKVMPVEDSETPESEGAPGAEETPPIVEAPPLPPELAPPAVVEVQAAKVEVPPAEAPQRPAEPPHAPVAPAPPKKPAAKKPFATF